MAVRICPFRQKSINEARRWRPGVQLWSCLSQSSAGLRSVLSHSSYGNPCLHGRCFLHRDMLDPLVTANCQYPIQLHASTSIYTKTYIWMWWCSHTFRQVVYVKICLQCFLCITILVFAKVHKWIIFTCLMLFLWEEWRVWCIETRNRKGAFFYGFFFVLLNVL